MAKDRTRYTDEDNIPKKAEVPEGRIYKPEERFTKSESQKCSTCIYIGKFGKADACRIKPPQLHMPGQAPWPPVMKDIDWCGEWKA